jgi:hypothetical protein
VGDVFFGMEKQNIVSYQWIGLREKLQEWENLWFPVSIFP